MKKNKIMGTLMVGALAASVIVPMGVSAEENQTEGKHTASLQLAEGDFILETSNVTSFGAHKIGAAKKVVDAEFENKFFVTDARGTQEGWDVSVVASPFTIVEPAGGWVKENAYSLPMGSLTLDTIDSVVGVYGEEAAIHPTVKNLGVAIDLGAEVSIASAEQGKGMGKYEIGFGAKSLHLVIDPVTAKIDKINYPTSVTPYESTITWNLVSGPGSSK